MRILILGAKGMLGTELSSVLGDLNPTLWDQEDLNITQESAVRNKITVLNPELIINAAAYTDVDGAETNQDTANQINGKAVEILGVVANKIGAVLVHYSTDYVFDGRNKKGYKEDNATNPINAYGKSKLLGEKAIKKNCQKYYLIRTSWLFGKHGKNFVKTIIQLGKSKKEIKVVADQFGQPTYTVDLALKTRELVEAKKEYGIYHITNEGITSWYDFTREIFRQIGLTVKVTPVATSEFPRPARRPEYSILINTKLTPMRSWKEALGDYLGR